MTWKECTRLLWAKFCAQRGKQIPPGMLPLPDLFLLSTAQYSSISRSFNLPIELGTTVLVYDSKIIELSY